MRNETYRRKYFAFLFIITLLMTGCSSAPIHKHLDTTLTNKTYDTVVLSKIPKEEISVPVQEKRYTSTGGADGLLWLLIDKGINKARASSVEETIAPLLKATADVDFRTQYWSQLEPLLSGSPWLKVTRLDKRTLGYKKEEAEKIKAPFLILTTFYQLSSDFQTLLVQTKAQLYLQNTSKPDYFGFMSYYSGKIGKNNEEDSKAVELWVANNAAAYRKALAEGIDQNMKMLRLDLLDRPANPQDEQGEEFKLTLRSPVSDSSQTLQGKVLDRKGSRLIFRDVGGNLFSIDTASQE
ncbi:hypothetical protein GMLC_23610 [Geomonas limicola]|uniref:Lipoprotein n=1 Tax=Geomonas limicola TaxID=2740186 RepID=A0A6V8N875_9BACT|nr:hypothetical protein [Geomonas limicola]GFO68782.1 hypothetical protein GMLC_23610 [Geomonas limicola]